MRVARLVLFKIGHLKGLIHLRLVRNSLDHLQETITG